MNSSMLEPRYIKYSELSEKMGVLYLISSIIEYKGNKCLFMYHNIKNDKELINDFAEALIISHRRHFRKISLIKCYSAKKEINDSMILTKLKLLKKDQDLKCANVVWDNYDLNMCCCVTPDERLANPTCFEDFVQPIEIENIVIKKDIERIEQMVQECEFMRELADTKMENEKKFELLSKMIKLNRERQTRVKEKLIKYWVNSLHMRNIKIIDYNTKFSDFLKTSKDSREFRLIMNQTPLYKQNYHIVDVQDDNFNENDVKVAKISLNGHIMYVRDRYFGMISNPEKIDIELFLKLYNNRKENQEILEGIQKNIYGCLINLHRMSDLNLNSIYYSISHRSFILWELKDGIYHEINTKFMRIVKCLEVCQKYEEKIPGYFKRTKKPVKPYGYMFYRFSESIKEGKLPHISNYGDIVSWPIEKLKDLFWIKIYGHKHRKNTLSKNIKIIRNACWNYTKVVSCDTFLYSFESANFILDKSRRR